MDANIKISIIIPVYNACSYLEQCLDSVIAQTISSKEIICIDDGSTDCSGEILREYERNYDNIRCYAQKNQGAGAARNYGLHLAQGEFVAFLDADDFYIDRNALDKMYTACIKNRIKVCGSFLSKNVNEQILQLPLHRNIFESGNTQEVLVQYRDYQCDYFYISYIYARRMLTDNSICFPLYRRYQDPPFFVRAMLAADRFCVVPVECYCFRESEASLNRKKTYIADALRGMIDNLIAARDNNLKILHNLTVDRINNEYYEAIVENAFQNNFEVLDLLRKADSLVDWQWYDSGKEHGELLPLSIIKDNQDSKQFANRLSEIRESHYVLTLWLKSHFGNSIGNYLKEKGIQTIAIYGYGFLGKMLYQEIQNTNIEIRYIIDKRKQIDTNVLIIGPLAQWQQVDAIIISPLDYNGILREWKNKLIYPTYILKNILMELAEG